MHVLYVLGRHAEALDLGQKCIEAREGAARDLTECDAALLRSLSGATEATAATKAFCDGIALVERHGWTNFLLLLPVEAGLIASRALRQDRAAAVFRDAIRERRLPAPSDQGTSWPWPLRVFLFSGMRLERFDEPMRFTGKVQRKPLELIKYLACARDQQADHASVCAALWPDAEESAARRSLEMATARLREMLGNPNWIRVTDNRTRLDPSFVWCDVQSVHRLCLEAERASRNPELARLRQIADDLLELYRGVLLDGEEDSPWVLGIRERVRTEFVRGVRALTAALQILGHDRADIDLLERALAAEPLAEELAQRLMMAQLQRRQPAEAMRVYRHLRQMLSVLLGSAPSIESDRLRDLILHQQQERSTT